MKPLPMTLRDRPRPGRVQMSHANPLPRRRSRRAERRRPADRHAPRLSRDEFARRWSLLMIRSFPSREACSVHFEVTFQTACNWFDGHCRPYGDQVDHAWRTLPAYARVMGEGRG